MNGTKGSSNNKEINENKYVNFLKREIKNAGSSIQFQHLLGNLPQLDFNAKCEFGIDKADLLKFLKGHSDIFQINEKGYVSLLKSDAPKRNSRNSSPTGSVELRNSLPPSIKSGFGIVTKVFPAFGFIHSKEPVKTSVYFAAKDFGNENKNLLSDYDIFHGRKLCFNAVRGLPDYEAKYRATKVWFPPQVQNEAPVEQKKTRKNRETGLYDPERKTDYGVIQKVFPNFGFIIVDGDEKNTIFFDKTHVQKYANIVDLTQILKMGDEVEYCAMRSTKKNAKARWEATQVWIKKVNEDIERNGLQEFDHGDMNDSRSGSFKSYKKKSAQSCSASDAGDAKNSTNRMLIDKVGKIFPRSQGVVLKFGPNMEELVDADSSLFYLCGTKVVDIAWEFSEGDEVHFDAVKIKSAPGWKAVLVWVGERPDIILPTCVGDFSEFNDEEIDEVETGSYTSKTSAISLLSEKSNSSKKSIENVSYQSSHSESKYSSPKFGSGSKLGVNSYNKLRKSISSEIHSRSSDFGEFETASEKNSVPLSRSTSKASLDLSEESERSTAQSRLSGKNKKHKRSRRKAADKKDDLSSFKYESVGNWGDTPYPDGEDDDEITDLGVKGDVLSSSIPQGFEVNEFEGKYEVLEKNENLHNVENSSICDNYENVLSHCNSERKNAPEMPLGAGLENDLQTHEISEICTVADNEQKLKVKPCIKTHNSINGKIQKVFCRYAVLENDCLRSPIAVFWNDFFRNGVSVEEHFDDLKEVLKPGDIVQFNCFEIVDDFGDYVHKATMAWIGQKPKVKQMTPEQFIKSENLSVTITKESDEDESVVQKSSESMRLLNKINNENVPPKKFLSVAYSNLENEDDSVCRSSNQSAVNENIQNSALANHLPCENSSDDDFVEEKSDSVTLSSDKSQRSSRSSDLPEIISRMLKNKGVVCTNSEVDLDALSFDIVNFILKYSGAKEISFENKIKSVDKGIQTVTDESSTLFGCSEEVSKNLTRSNSTQFKETQTIVTGEVIAAKVFTQ